MASETDGMDLSKQLTLHVSGPKNNLVIWINGLLSGKRTPADVDVEIGDIVHVSDLLHHSAWVVQGHEKYIRFSSERAPNGYLIYADVGHGDTMIGYKPDYSIEESEFVSAVRDMDELKVLDASACRRISSVEILSGMRELWVLDLRATRVSDLTPIMRMNNLRLLYVSSTPVRDVSPLKYLAELRALDLRLTRVSDISPLATLKKLKVLNLESTQVSSISVLAHLERLEMLVLSKTKVSLLDMVYLNKQLPFCKIYQ